MSLTSQYQTNRYQGFPAFLFSHQTKLHANTPMCIAERYGYIIRVCHPLDPFWYFENLALNVNMKKHDGFILHFNLENGTNNCVQKRFRYPLFHEKPQSFVLFVLLSNLRCENLDWKQMLVPRNSLMRDLIIFCQVLYT